MPVSIKASFRLKKHTPLLWLLTFTSFNVFSQPNIEWGKYQLPPIFITAGEYQNQGGGDAIFRFLQSHLDNYSHTTYTSSGVRIMRDFRLKNLVCSTMTKKKGRDEFMYFSKPITIIPSHNLHYSTNNLKLKSILEDSKTNGVISLEQLLKNPIHLVIGLNTHRSFGDDINDILSRYSQQVEHIDETTSTAELLGMLSNQRIDLTLELPFISYFIIRSQPLTTPVNIEPLLETSTFVKAYIACSRTDAGLKAISAINKIIKKHRTTIAYQKMYEDWIPEKSLASFRAGFQKISVDTQ